MLHKLAPLTAWACLLFVASVTLSPAYLRPRLMETEPALIVILEHVGAFAVIGFLFSVSYTRTTLVCLLVLGSAVILELLQLVVPDRDARVIDAVEKLIGGGVGIIAAKILCPHFRGFRARLCTRHGERDRPSADARVACCSPARIEQISCDSRKDQGRRALNL
jgi:VanZ family protein